ncbi:MAG: phytoene desaturase [Opitutales bacterium]|nr:phytoene desaturase [Opitutales bacterium]MCH8540183.1 phytoene desaturase [Opitutales bacterium]
MPANSPETPETLVIGAGLGGLSAAIHLAARGRKVHLLEKNDRPGGKCHVFERDGFRFDTGPSVLTMPFVLDELFAAAGEKTADHLTIEPVEPACRYFFSDGTRFDAPGNQKDFLAAIAREFPDDAVGAEKFFAYTARLWEVSEPFFLSAPLDWRVLRKARPRHLRGGLAMMKPGSLHRVVRSYFRDPRLIQLFDRFATYNGSDPYRTPPAFNVISHVEFTFGSWRVRGGMYTLVEEITALARRLGVQMTFNASVEKILFAPNRATGVRVNGETIPAKGVVVNPDAISAWTRPLLEEHPQYQKRKKTLARQEASSSGFVLLLALKKQFPRLDRHNIFFPENYRHEFTQLFRDQCPLNNPTLYLSRLTDDPAEGLVPPGHEGWFVLANAPARPEASRWKNYEDTLLHLLEQKIPEFSAQRDILWQEVRSPNDFQERFGAWKGSLYGASSNNFFAAFQRIRNADTIPNLAFAGGSAHPGGGIPLVLRSGQMAANSLIN